MKQIIRLNSNENPLGASPDAKFAAQEVLQNPHIYPDSDYQELKNVIAGFYSVSANQITLGNGSENVLELIIKTFLQTHESAIISEFTFLTISMLLKNHGIKAKIIASRKWQDDISAMIAAVDKNTRMIFLVNPGNPVGSYTNHADFSRLMHSVPSNVLVIMDEAYAEYITNEDYPDTISFLPQFPNLIITRTFSKIHGLAALRIGYALSSREIAARLDQHRLPYNVNALAAKAACAALQDQEHVKKSIMLNAENRSRLETALLELELEVLPSTANFLTVTMENATLTCQKLLEQGIMVFPLNNYGMPNHVRISVGTREESKLLIDSIKNILAN